ncbi:MAG: hypothetical protein M3N33_10390 [Actinomycetota bacterium]|nr:hypothetical protein [Actinomycetota bacterium]
MKGRGALRITEPKRPAARPLSPRPVVLPAAKLGHGERASEVRILDALSPPFEVPRLSAQRPHLLLGVAAQSLERPSPISRCTPSTVR